MNHRTWLVVFTLMVGLGVIYFFTSGGNTPFNHFVLLADAFLKGNFYIEGIYPWIEKAPLDETRFFIVNPPMPAILLIPFVKIWGLSFPQQLFAHIIGIGLSVSTFFLSLKIKKDDNKLAIWSALLIGIGSIVWFLSSVGSVWYLGQITAAFFLTLAIVESLDKKRPIILGILLGATYLSRIHLVLTFPIFAFLLWKENKQSLTTLKQSLTTLKQSLPLRGKKLIPLVLFSIPILLFIGFDFFYNFTRYGTIFNKGYFLIPGTQNEPWFAKGIMHPSYIIEDIKIAFLAMPKIISEFPYIRPSWVGMAIWLTTPAFIFAFWANIKKQIVKLFWLAIGIVFLVVGLHGGTGFAQFGYRFAVDFYPFLTYLTILGVKNQKGPHWYHWVFLSFGIIVNLWGVIWINKFNWIGW